MDAKQAEHLARVRHLRESFVAANEHLVKRLRAATDADAERRMADGWSAAQVGSHVASVNTLFAALVAGELAAAKPLEPGFVERPWAAIAAAMPAKLQAPAATQPAGPVSRHDAIAALEASAVRMASALDTLTPERGTGIGVTNPLVGTINLYQVAEWAAAHAWRHDAQADRALTA
jgi:uncharacterized damage-inducible protein DinB